MIPSVLCNLSFYFLHIGKLYSCSFAIQNLTLRSLFSDFADNMEGFQSAFSNFFQLKKVFFKFNYIVIVSIWNVPVHPQEHMK